jgi:hypothetical protein
MAKTREANPPLSTSVRHRLNFARGAHRATPKVAGTAPRPFAALLTNDTGTMHLADGFGVPLVVMFSST